MQAGKPFVAAITVGAVPCDRRIGGI
jgi:hypothetical protein